MSDAWKPYIDRMEASGLQLSGIFGKDGNCWSASSKMSASQPEMKAVVDSINSNDFSKGIVIGGKKYTMIGANKDSQTLTAKCRTADKDEEKYLLHIALSNQAVLVGGICGPNERAAIGHVEDIRDYLAKSGY